MLKLLARSKHTSVWYAYQTRLQARIVPPYPGTSVTVCGTTGLSIKGLHTVPTARVSCPSCKEHCVPPQTVRHTRPDGFTVIKRVFVVFAWRSEVFVERQSVLRLRVSVLFLTHFLGEWQTQVTAVHWAQNARLLMLTSGPTGLCGLGLYVRMTLGSNMEPSRNGSNRLRFV
jgi:hypothetical protein